MTAEVTPPVSCDAEDLLDKALPLKGLADAVNVTDGAGARAHLGALASAVILQRNGIEPVLQLTCRDRNRLALQSDLLGAAALGIRNLLVLRGDDPTAGDQPDAKPVFDLDSGALIATAVGIRDRGELPSGRKVTGKADFFIGAADMPIDPPKDWQPKSLKAKIAAGAQFAQTQFCMDIDVVKRYVARLAQDRLTDKISLLIGVVPLRSAQFGALDQGAAVRRDHSRRHRGAAGIFRRSGRPRASRSASISSRSFPRCRASPARTSWRRTTRPRSRT